MSEQFWDKGIMLVTGCTKVSEGCKNCWSETIHCRFMEDPKQTVYLPELMTNGRFNGKTKVHMHRLEAACKKRKPTVYAIWNDLYHEGVSDEQIDEAFGLMMSHTHHTYLIITKRPERAASWWNGSGLPRMIIDFSMRSIWHIVTMENQAMVDKRMPHLLQIPGKRGIIIEPMLEAVSLFPWVSGYHECLECGDWLINPRTTVPVCRQCCPPKRMTRKDWIHQVILGKENAPNARPFDPAWADSVEQQCKLAGVPFHNKTTGKGIWHGDNNQP